MGIYKKIARDSSCCSVVNMLLLVAGDIPQNSRGESPAPALNDSPDQDSIFVCGDQSPHSHDLHVRSPVRILRRNCMMTNLRTSRF